MLTEEQVLAALEDVKDPEIPVVSIVELGLVAEVLVEPGSVRVKLTPTFVGCPAVEFMRAEAETRLRALGVHHVSVQVSLDPPWSSNRISEAGRRKLKAFGLAPPHVHTGAPELIQIALIACPSCGSEDTVMDSLFGPAPCRAIHYCNNCKQSFEQFKPL